MEEFLNNLAANGAVYAYVGIALLLIGGGFGLPIPEDIPLIVGGVLCAKGVTSLEIMLPLTFICVMGGDSALFFIGRRFGPRLPEMPVIGRFMKPERMARARIFFADHGGKTLFAARFMPGLRAVFFASAGALHVPYWKMFMYDGIAALVSVPVWVLVGDYLGQKLTVDEIKNWGFEVQLGIIGGVVVLAVVIWLVKRHLKKRSLAKMPAIDPTAPAPTEPRPGSEQL